LRSKHRQLKGILTDPYNENSFDPVGFIGVFNLRKMSKRLGYTFYPKDWRSDDKVIMLNAEERDMFRFFIDECFIKSSAKLDWNLSYLRRILGHNKQKVERIFKVLCNFGLVYLEGDYIVIPSVINRLGFIEEQSDKGKLGGLAKSQILAKEKEKEKEKYKEKEEEEEDNRHRQIKELCIDYKKNERVINAVLKNGQQLAFSKEDLLAKLDDFILHLESTDDTVKQDKDFKSHFLNWLRIQKKKSSEKKEKPTPAQKVFGEYYEEANTIAKQLNNLTLQKNEQENKRIGG
jgi:hypothetical protein